MSNYYKPSGKLEPISWAYFAGIILVGAPILGLIYTYLIWYIPIIYVNFLVTAGLGFGMGFLVNFLVVQKGKVRNPSIAGVMGLVAGLAVMYLHWSVWVDMVINAGESYGNERIGVTVSSTSFLQVFALALDPAILAEIVGEINEYGTWGIRGATVSGIFLAIIWVIELLAVIGIAAFMPFTAAKDPFSEKNNEWYNSQELPRFNYIDEPHTLVSALETSDLKAFENLGRAADLEGNQSKFTLYTIDNDTSYLTVENMLATTNSKGKLEFDEDEVVGLISIEDRLRDELLKK